MIAYTVFLIKAMMLNNISHDNSDTFKKSIKGRIMKSNFIFRIVAMSMFFIGLLKAISRCNNKGFTITGLDLHKSVLFFIVDLIKTTLFFFTAASFF